MINVSKSLVFAGFLDFYKWLVPHIIRRRSNLARVKRAANAQKKKRKILKLAKG